MKDLRSDEQSALAMIQLALNVPVVQYDDGTAQLMHDLNILYGDGRIGAVEITAAADERLIELWNLVNGETERTIEPTIAGGWILTLSYRTRVNDLNRELPGFLRSAEDAGIRQLDAGDPKWTEALQATADRLGIVRGHQSPTDFPGSINFLVAQSPERTGGAIAPTGDALALWIGRFLTDKERGRKIDKLRRAVADERHVFVTVPGFADASFAVTELLLRDVPVLPTVDPILPDDITHVWIIGGWGSGYGFRWSQQAGWALFDKSLPGRKTSHPA